MAWGTCPTWLLPRDSFGMPEPARPGREQGMVTPGTALHSQHGLLRFVLFEKKDFWGFWESLDDKRLRRSWLCQGVWKRLSVTQSWSHLL